MAEVSQSPLASPFPPTPPPPIYSQVPLRSHSPHVSTNDASFRQEQRAAPGSFFGRTVSLVMPMADEDTRPGASALASVQVHPPHAVTDDRNGQQLNDSYDQKQLPHPPFIPHDPSRLSPIPSTVTSRKPLDERSRNLVDSTHKRISSESTQARPTKDNDEHQKRSMRHVSASVLDAGVQNENHQPLQYHHQILEESEMREVEKRASKLTFDASRLEGAASSDALQRLDPDAGPSVRNSTYGNAIQRPDSGFSSTSEVRGRTLSLQVSPNARARVVSRNSRSPDPRPVSYIDLLNVPYPQPAPSGAENLINAGLRTVIGANASLLSTRKTLDMYQANVKKTNDPAIQYEFAVFMISAAQEEGLENDDSSDAALSEKSHGSIREDLLKEAKNILQKLSDRSYPFAQYYLADGFASGLFNNGKADLERSYPLFLAASKHGHAEAAYRTALCHEFGWGCRQDAAKAVQFYQHAASKNHPGAMLRLGRACLTGDMGLIKRYREGVRWLKRGAESADFQYNQAPYDLAQLHETGFGSDVFKDESYAAQLYTKAADLGHKDANFRLGEAYEYGQLNCPRDPALSVHFYTGAAEQGHPLGQMALCAWYMVGIDQVLEKDESEAYEWARRAAAQGLPKAQYTIGYFTEMGIGCRRDPLEANVLYVQAADQGEERAKHRLAAIRAAATGADPVTAAAKKGKSAALEREGFSRTPEGEKRKRFGIF